jgi:hypothetical protein
VEWCASKLGAGGGTDTAHSGSRLCASRRCHPRTLNPGTGLRRCCLAAAAPAAPALVQLPPATAAIAAPAPPADSAIAPALAAAFPASAPPARQPAPSGPWLLTCRQGWLPDAPPRGPFRPNSARPGTPAAICSWRCSGCLPETPRRMQSRHPEATDGSERLAYLSKATASPAVQRRRPGLSPPLPARARCPPPPASHPHELFSGNSTDTSEALGGSMCASSARSTAHHSENTVPLRWQTLPPGFLLLPPFG